MLTAVLVAASTMLATTVGGEASDRTSRIIWVPLYRQIHGLDCEAAALQMAMAHERIFVSQNRILSATGIDSRQPVTDGTGFHWGNPNTSFVGNPDGSEIRQTGYGEYAPAIGRVARQFGARVMDARQGISTGAIYWALSSGHPVVAWVSFDVLVNNPWHGTRQWISKRIFEAAYATFGDMAVVLW